MRKLLLFTLLLGLFSLSSAQDVYKFAVKFTDKTNTPFSIDKPEEFLSQRSISRRARAYVEYTEEDLPIDPAYIAQVLATTSDAKLIIQVKWMNTIIISLSDSNHIIGINNLPIVEKSEMVFNFNLKKNNIKKLEQVERVIQNVNYHKESRAYDSAFYGGAWVQTHQLNVEKMHERGYRGQGKVIAVLDAGFISADTLQIFENLWANEQILGTYNFVSPGQTVFASHSHGTSVLSTMGGYWEGSLVGTAPDASYWLLRTEDGASENIIEEYNWVAGAAFADSVGADVLNTSLGYIDFDDARFDHKYEDLDGDKTVITRGANMAYRKGMLPVNSAGNSGSNSWRYLGAPADATEILTIGAVNGDEVIASFSSHGFPWSDDVKPDIVARGQGTYVASAYQNAVGQGNGTSFSSPVSAGAVASLWSVNPNLSPYWIRLAIQQSADRFLSPDTLYGYGLPNFEQAMNILGVNNQSPDNNIIKLFPNPVHSILYLNINIEQNTSFSLSIIDMQGRELLEKEMNYSGSQLAIDLTNYPSGIYILETKINGRTNRIKINKL